MGKIPQYTGTAVAYGITDEDGDIHVTDRTGFNRIQISEDGQLKVEFIPLFEQPKKSFSLESKP